MRKAIETTAWVMLICGVILGALREQINLRSTVLIWDTWNKCINHCAQKTCRTLLSMLNCALVHAPCADVNGQVVACVSSPQITFDPQLVVLKIYDLGIKLCRNNCLHTHHNSYHLISP